MVHSGCIAVLIGFESLDADNLKQMRKGWAIKKGPYAERIRILRKAGLMIYGTFVFGYDNDRRDVFDRTAEFAIDNKFFLANFNPLTPMPGTGLYDRLKAEGRLLVDRWWLDEDYRYGDAAFRAVVKDDQRAAQDVLVHRDEFWRLSEQVLQRQAERLALDDPDRLVKHRLQTDILDKLRRVYMLAEHLASVVLPANVVARELEAQV